MEDIEKLLPTMLHKLNLCASRSDAKRIVILGGVSVNGEKVTDTRAFTKHGDILKIGKIEARVPLD